MTYQLFKDTLLEELKKIDAERTYTIDTVPVEHELKEILICQTPEEPCAAMDLSGLFQEFLKRKDSNVEAVARLFHSYIRINEIPDDGAVKFEQVKDYLCCRLVNPKQRADLLKKTPSIPYLDLAVIFYIDFGQWENIYGLNCIITNKNFNDWDISLEELYTLAKKNTLKLNLPKILPLKQELTNKDWFPQNLFAHPGISKRLASCFVITNEKDCWGTAALLFPEIFEYIAQTSKQDLYLLLINEHKIGIEPATTSLSSLQSMMKEMHSLPSSTLSDKVYCYRKGTRQVSICFGINPLKQ